jgi:hypothetical protein
MRRPQLALKKFPSIMRQTLVGLSVLWVFCDVRTGGLDPSLQRGRRRMATCSNGSFRPQPSTSGFRLVAREMSDNGLLDPGVASVIERTRGVKQRV